MDWQTLIISICSIVITSLATWGMAKLTQWLDFKLEGKKSESYINDIVSIVLDCVKVTYQTYVESIKGTDAWTKEAQENALKMSLEAAKKHLGTKFIDYITTNFGDVDVYLTNLIEALIYDLKK